MIELQNLKIQLDEYIKKYETPEFIKDDPINFLYKFKNKKQIVDSITIQDCGYS